MGVSASSKLGGAVVRNRLRRMVKEIIRLNAVKLLEDTDLILIVRKPALSLPYKEMEGSILHVLRKAGLLKGSSPNIVNSSKPSSHGKRPNNRNGKQGK
jgi:ribonuclease P protein component